MLNYLWSGMIVIGIVVAVFTGRMAEVTNAVLESAKDAITVCITMLGILSMWMGLMKIAEQAGIIRSLSKKMMPLLRWLFPDIPEKSPALTYIATNILANMLGLGWASTPAGLKAMEELQKHNAHKSTASRAMCMFMVLNMSSLQLVTVSVVAYRSQYNSASPSEIIGPGLLATIFSTIVSVIFVKVCERWAKP